MPLGLVDFILPFTVNEEIKMKLTHQGVKLSKVLDLIMVISST